MKSKNCLLFAFALALTPFSASAGTITIADLFNTGVNSTGAVLADGTVDSHYTITAAPNGAQVATKTPAGYPFPNWAANDSNSAWIGLNTASASGPVGNYTYHTTFTLAANAILSSVSINGLWGTDDQALAVYINGLSTGLTLTGFSTLSAFSINSGFHAGANTLDFVVYNGSGPTGLRIDNMVGTYQAPDGGLTAMLLGASMLGLVAFRRRFAK